MKTKVLIASDHAGLELKNSIVAQGESLNVEFKDLGTFNTDSVDYPDQAASVANMISDGSFSCGVLICGTGIGMSITANKFPGVRAALVSDLFSAKMARAHNDANVLVLGSRVIKKELALEIVKTFFSSEFEGGRHEKRLEKIRSIEKMRKS